MSEQTARLLATLSHQGLLPILGLLIVFGVVMHYAGVGLARAKERADRQARRAAAIVRAASFTVLMVALPLLVLGFFHFGCAVMVSNGSRCLSNLRQLGTAVMTYAQDYDEHMPLAVHWAELIGPHIADVAENPFVCPSANSPGSYAMNAALSTTSLQDIPDPAETVLLFDADAPGRSFAGGQQDLAKTRHGGLPNVGFADGHAKHANEYVQKKLRWLLEKVKE